MQKTLAKESQGRNSDQIGKNLIQCLSTCEKGTELLVKSVNAGRMAKSRLADLGIVPGVKIIKKKSAPFNGPIEIEVKSSSLVLGRGLASKIIVECNITCNS